MSTTSQLTAFSDLLLCKRCNEKKPRQMFGQHAWCKTCCSQYNKAYKRKTVNKPTYEINRKRRLFTRFRITPEEYAKLEVQQSSLCAICGKPQISAYRTLDIDHDHITGQVRGLLCRNCNTALGQFKDSVPLLLKAADYLVRWK